jgi:hypothetical protein
MSHELSHSLQSAGRPNVPVSCHSCDSLLHWIVAWQTTSSEPQFEHTGVERAARRPVRSSTVRGTSGIKLNGLMSAVRRICFSPFGLVFGPQPTPAITFRKIINCDVAHFVVDCRHAAKGRNKKEPAGVNGGPASRGDSNRSMQITDSASGSHHPIPRALPVRRADLLKQTVKIAAAGIVQVRPTSGREPRPSLRRPGC